MYGSPPVSNDLNLPFPPPPPSSDQHRRHQQQQHQMSSGLLRYRSAPSTLLGDLCEDFLPVRPSSPETETMFARFLGSDLRPEIRDKPAASERSSHFAPPPPPATAADVAVAGGGIFSAPQMLYHPSQQQQQIPSHNPVDYRVVASMGLETEQIKAAGGVGGSGNNSSNLIRHSSSPAGLFAHLNAENGYGMMRGVGGSGSGGGGYRNGNGAIGEVASPSAAAAASSRLKGQISFSSRQNSASSGLMSQISEMASEELGGISPEGSSMGGGNSSYMPTGFPTGSWDESAMLSDGFSGLKRGRLVDAKLVAGLNQSEPRNGMGSTDMAALEKFLQFQDSVPCKIRAKRGCATHPRSIAERVRRTRISERMRKLQELVPNMDKQTNTADMLDLAVEHIKDLQREVKNLSDSRASCTCSSSKHKPYSKSGV